MSVNSASLASSPESDQAVAPQHGSALITNSPKRGFTVARVRLGRRVAVSRSPGARPYKSIPAFTEMGSRRHLPVVGVRRDWVAVVPLDKQNGKRVWIKRDDVSVRFMKTRYSIHVDVSRRRLVLRHGTSLVMRAHVAVGSQRSPTPLGRFAVTDKLGKGSLPSYYGCCVLALNARQPKLPPGWRGGDRMAIHGTNSAASIGQAASAGCVRAFDQPLRVLMQRVPLGAPVFIHR